jgi:hypothetical protein
MSTTEIETFFVKKRGRRLECKCRYKWIYCGKSELYAHCPKCRSTVTINLKRKHPGQKQQLQQIRDRGTQFSSEPSVATVAADFVTNPKAGD